MPSPPIVRKRVPQMSADEKNLLYKICLKYGAVIENKKSDAITNSKKKEAWVAILNAYNGTSGGVERSLDTLQNQYRNTLRNLKTGLSNEKFERFVTGGGTAKTAVNENHPLMSLAVKKTTPLRNVFDSSSSYLDNNNEVSMKHLFFGLHNYIRVFFTDSS